MQLVERKRIEAALVEAAKVGFHAYQVNDGGDNVPAQTVESVVTVVESVELASVHFKHEDGRRAWLVVALGNGEYCLTKHSVTPGFAEAIDRACFIE